MELKLKTEEGMMIFIYNEIMDKGIYFTKIQEDIKKNLKTFGDNKNDFNKNELSYIKWESQVVVTEKMENGRFRQFLVTPESVCSEELYEILQQAIDITIMSSEQLERKVAYNDESDDHKILSGNIIVNINQGEIKRNLLMYGIAYDFKDKNTIYTLQTTEDGVKFVVVFHLTLDKINLISFLIDSDSVYLESPDDLHEILKPAFELLNED
jgi:hypothetical protein